MYSMEQTNSTSVMSGPASIDSLLNGKRQMNLDEISRKKAKVSGDEPESTIQEVVELHSEAESEKPQAPEVEAKGMANGAHLSSQNDQTEVVEVLHSADSEVPVNEATSMGNISATPEPVANGEDLSSSIASSQHSTAMTSTTLPTTANTAQSEGTLTEKQLARLQKQKQREEERILRERKKEEDRIMKKLERERKDRERLLKKQLLEEEKEKKRAEEKQRREEKQRKVEEEKKRKEAERLKKEEEKKRKEEERKRLEEERKKQQEQKERSQMKISSFFSVKPAAKQPKVETVSPTAVKADAVKEETDPYGKQFLPFFVKKNAIMALSQQLSGEELAAQTKKIDSAFMSCEHLDFESVFSPAPYAPRKAFTTAEQLVEAFDSTTIKESEVSAMLERLPKIKYLQFYENAKPPYIGTWCSIQHTKTVFDTANPLDVSLTGFDYNYDSDLDWQDGDDEGEDIDDLEEGDGDEEDINDEDDMADFVEDNAESRKKLANGPLVPVTIMNDGSNPEVFSNLRFGIHAPLTFPIDPYKDYWGPSEPEVVSEAATPSKAPATPFSVGQLGSTPVQVKNPGSAASPNILTPQKPTIKDKKVLQDLIAFIEKNSDFTIGTLSELAKKEFKSYTKSMLKHTIQEIAAYNKKSSVWEIKEGLKDNS